MLIEKPKTKTKTNEDSQAIQYERVDSLHIWWLPQSFCQTHYGEYSEYGYSSCTLIALSLAQRLSKINNFRQTKAQLPKNALAVLGSAINDGNRAYKDKNVDSMVLTIPQGLGALRRHSKIEFNLSEWFFTHLYTEDQSNSYVASDMTNILMTTISRYQEFEHWESFPQLFAAITGDYRCVMLAIDLKNSVITLFDSHRHDQSGAVFIQTAIYYIKNLMNWYMNMMKDIFSSHPPVMELSFISPLPDIAERIVPAFDPKANKLF